MSCSHFAYFAQDLIVFGLGAVAAIARFAFDCLKGIFQFGYETMGCCLGIAIVLLLFLLFIALPTIKEVF